MFIIIVTPPENGSFQVLHIIIKVTPSEADLFFFNQFFFQIVPIFLQLVPNLIRVVRTQSLT